MLQGQVFGSPEATFIGTSVEKTWSGVHMLPARASYLT
jgi:hypothetical protein